MIAKLGLPVITDFDSANQAVNEIKNYLAVQNNITYTGIGSPEGKVSATVGSIYTDKKGEAGSILYVKESGGSTKTGWVLQENSTTPALTGKYVLPASYPMTGSWSATGLKITIPQDGFYLINSHAPIYGTTAGFNSQPTVEMRLNGTSISGTKTNCYLYAAPQGGVINQIYPCDYSFTGDYKAGDIIELYAWLQAGTNAYVYVNAAESGCFIQYTQLSKNVPVVTTVTKEYGHFYLYTANKSYSTNEVIKMQKDFGNIAYDQSTGYVYLKAGVSYRCTGSILSNSGQIGARFYNVTSGQELGQLSYTRPINANTADSINPICDSMITPTIDTIICFRVNNSSSGAIYGDSPYLYSSMHIESIEANIPVVATLGQDAWVGPMQTLIQTGGTVYYGQVKFSKDSSGQWFGEFWLCTPNTALTTTGITFKATGYDFYFVALSSDFTAAGGAYHSWFRFYNGASTIATGQSSSTSAAYYGMGLKIPLASKPVGYGIPDNI